MSTDPKEPSQLAVHAGISHCIHPSEHGRYWDLGYEHQPSEIQNCAITVQRAINQAYAERDAEIARLQKDVNDLNRLLRSVGWGQGEIDSSATLAEESEAKDAEIAKLKTDLQDADRINNELCGVIVRNAQRMMHELPRETYDKLYEED